MNTKSQAVPYPAYARGLLPSGLIITEQALTAFPHGEPGMAGSATCLSVTVWWSVSFLVMLP